MPSSDSIRHRLLYPEFFAGFDPAFYPLSRELFTELWRQPDVESAWLDVHVHKAAPSDVRPTWLYVTCGLSDPELATDACRKEGLSGLGCEFRIETTAEASWPVIRLRETAALQILLSAGRLKNKKLLDVDDVIPLNTSLSGDRNSALRWLLVAPASRRPYTFQLPSGLVHFRSLLGITDEEAAFSQQFGASNLVVLLERNGWFPLIVPERKSIVTARSP